MTAPLARIDRAAGVVTLHKGAHALPIPFADLPRWLKTYRALRDRKGGQYAESYARDVVELERVHKRLEEVG